MNINLKIFEFLLLFYHKNGIKTISLVLVFLIFFVALYIITPSGSRSFSSFSTTSPSILRCSTTNVLVTTTTSTETNVMVTTTTSSHQGAGDTKTGLHHIVFGIGSSANNWEHRKSYVKYWWRPGLTRGFVWLDRMMINTTTADKDEEEEEEEEEQRYSSTSYLNNYPTLKVSSDTSKFEYTSKDGIRDALRMTRIVSEMVRMGLEDVRWFVLGDDDTVFFTENLVRVLCKYDHTQMYYIGSNSETHFQDIVFHYGMAFGGGGIAVSYPLAKAVERMQDRCIDRNPGLYGSDDRLHACFGELGVPLTKVLGFHQLDMYGDISGFLSAHPVAPLVTLHHLDVVDPIFPFLDKASALHRLKASEKLDSAGLMQQSFCYDAARNWTVSISWGYSVHIYPDIVPPRELEKPLMTFKDWYMKDDPASFTFNTRPIPSDPCRRPYVYYLKFMAAIPGKDDIVGSEYARIGYDRVHGGRCDKVDESKKLVDKVIVFKKPDPYLWDKAPRRNCCRVIPSDRAETMKVSIDACKEGDVIESK